VSAVMEVSDVVEEEDKSTEESQQEEVLPQQQQQLNGKKISWPKLRRYDSLDIESRTVKGHAHGHGSKVSLINSPTIFFTYVQLACPFFPPQSKAY
jgi:hypothetical protein